VIDTAQGTQVTQGSPFQITATVTTAPAAGSSYLLREPEEWTWEDLRSYVMSEAERRFGTQFRDSVKEAATFKGHISRYGILASVIIAQAAFEVYDGVWANAPVTYTRFCKGSDAFFSDVILERVMG